MNHGGYDKDYVVDLMKNIRDAKYLCDVTLIAGLDQRRFPVHRYVMVASSPYFQALLGPNYKEANQNEVILKAINGATLDIIINYCYSGTVCIDNENVEDIMDAASSMEMVHLEEKCINFWRQQLDADNCIKILLIAEQYNSVDLRNKAWQKICWNLKKIPIADMLELDENIFSEILKNDKIDAAETDIFDRFVQWIEHDEANRSQFVASMAKSIRLEFVPTEFLNETVLSFYEKYGYDFVNPVTDEKANRKQNRKPFRLHRFTPKLYCADLKNSRTITIHKFSGSELPEVVRTIPIETPRKNCIFSSGKAFLFDDINVAEGKMDSYDLITYKKETVHDVPLNPMFGSLISVGKYVYILAKHAQARDDVSFLNCYRFDTEQKMWEKRESLPHRIGNLSMIELNGLIYVVGRLKRTQNCTSNFWCYNPISNVWTEKAHTTVKKWSPYQFVEINLVKIDETICISNTEIGFIKYDSAANRWTELEFDAPILHKERKVNYTFTLYDAIDLKKNSFGLMSADEGDLYVEICMYNDCCSFDADCLQYLNLYMDVSEKDMHLFVY